MCGICGIVNFNGKKIDEKILKKMNDVLYHRGPDEEGYYIKSQVASRKSQVAVGMGMRRLSIIDLEGGSQPIYNGDKSIAIIENGEIYNFLELRKDLEKRHRFYTKTDTEVVVHLYEEYGIDCLKYLRGMFAFAIWDDNRKQLFLARDRVGKKPLYYTWLNGNFYFASEMKSFLEVSEFKKEINLKAIHYYLTYQYIPSPMTIWKGVYRLEPASYLVLNKEGRLKMTRYWSIDFRKKTKLSFEESKRRIRDLLKEAVRLRLISDVPLGAFLSGGIDSSIIVGFMSQLSSKPVKTFSIGFQEQEFSELEYARIVAKRFGCDHHEFIVKPDYIDILPKIVWHYDQPYADSSALPSYYVAQMARRFVKVALNGDGGDENFAGYNRYKYQMLLCYRIYDKLPELFKRSLNRFANQRSHSLKEKNFFGKLRRFFKYANMDVAERYFEYMTIFKDEEKRLLYNPEMKKSAKDIESLDYLKSFFLSYKGDDSINKFLYVDLLTYLPEDLLVKMDIATMMNSLEVRSPFLDHKLIEFVAGIRGNLKLRRRIGKYILKEALDGFLPPEIIKRDKMGFGIPISTWFKADWKNYFREVVLSKKSLSRGYFNKVYIEMLWKQHISGYKDNGYKLWMLLMLELWHRVYMDNEI